MYSLLKNVKLFLAIPKYAGCLLVPLIVVEYIKIYKIFLRVRALCSKRTMCAWNTCFLFPSAKSFSCDNF